MGLRTFRLPLTASPLPLARVYPSPDSYARRVIADGASNYWRLNEASGTSAVDVIGGANGTISGGVTLAQAGALADGDQAMAFNGVDGKIAFAPRTIAAPLSVEAWIKTSAVGVYLPWWSNRNPATAGGGLLELDYQNAMRVHVNLVGGTPVDILGQGRSGLNDGVWHHIVWTNDGTTTRSFIDGVLDVTAAQTYPTPAGPHTETIGADTVLARFFTGQLDDVAIYPRALTAPEISAHYAASLLTTSFSATDAALDIPYRQLTFQTDGSARLGEDPPAAAPGLLLSPAVPLTLGPFKDAGPLRLSDLSASGSGTLTILGVPF